MTELLIIVAFVWLGVAGGLGSMCQAYCEVKGTKLNKLQCLCILLWPVIFAVTMAAFIFYNVFLAFTSLLLLVIGLFKE